jgi:hypothetical protein
VTAFAVGQYVELLVTVPSGSHGSIESGTRGIVRDVDFSHSAGERFLVEFAWSERVTGEKAWLDAIALAAA